MTEPRDQIDDWLGQDVEPLVPPPGTFERIHHQARGRRRRQAVLAATGGAVVVIVAVLVPTVGAGLLHGSRPSPSPAEASVKPSPVPSQSSAISHSAHPRKGHSASTPAGQGTGLSATSSGTSPPPHFRPTSITMIGAGIGAVIGQAGPPCATQYCTSLAGTSTLGQSWYGVSAPYTGASNGSTGVGQLRFLNIDDGWAFGPQLWATTDGGRNWASVPTYGMRVTGLEAAGTRAFAILGEDCRGTGRDYGTGCAAVSLYSLAPGRTTLQPVRLVIPAARRAGALGGAGQAASASLVIADGPDGDRGYLLTPGGDILSGPLTGAAWQYLGQAPCAPGAATADGAPGSAQLAVGEDKILISCDGTASGSGAGRSQARQLYASHDGVTWTRVSRPPAGGLGRSLASASSGQVLLATTAGIYYSPDGRTWLSATLAGQRPPGGFSYVGMTTATQGIALPADAGVGEVFVTTDGGLRWSPSPIDG